MSWRWRRRRREEVEKEEEDNRAREEECDSEEEDESTLPKNADKEVNSQLAVGYKHDRLANHSHKGRALAYPRIHRLLLREFASTWFIPNAESFCSNFHQAYRLTRPSQCAIQALDLIHGDLLGPSYQYVVHSVLSRLLRELLFRGDGAVLRFFACAIAGV